MASGNLERPNLQRLFVDPEMDLAPDAPLGASMLARVPLTFAFDLDAGAIDQQVQGTLRAAIGNVHGEGLLTAR